MHLEVLTQCWRSEASEAELGAPTWPPCFSQHSERQSRRLGLLAKPSPLGQSFVRLFRLLRIGMECDPSKQASWQRARALLGANGIPHGRTKPLCHGIVH